MASGGREFQEIQSTLKKAAAALREAGIPFALGGSLAVWARGGPETCNDLDLMVREEDAERALDVLVEAGMRSEHPPEEWLLKAWDGDVLVDLIHHAVGVPVTESALERADELSVFSVTMRVMVLEDVIVSKLLALCEHELDYEPLLAIARSVREQVDWREVMARTSHSPYARAFFALLDELEVDVTGSHEAPGHQGSKIRVLPPASS